MAIRTAHRHLNLQFQAPARVSGSNTQLSSSCALFCPVSFPSQQIAVLWVLPESLEFSVTLPVPAALTALGLSNLDTKHMYMNPIYYSQSWLPTPSLPSTFEFGIIFVCVACSFSVPPRK